MEMEVDTLSAITEQYFEDWFSKRKLRGLSYQKDILINKIPESLKNNLLPTVLAACPSSGKTLLSISYLDFFLKQNPSAKVLVLTHGTTVLRSQYHEEVIKSNPDFSYEEIEIGNQLAKSKTQVIITLPQTLHRLKKLPKFDLLVVDEAHEFYFAEMIKKIIKKTQPKKQLLLTGTPSSFIYKKFPIIPVTVSQLLKYNMVSDLIVEIASSTYDFKVQDYTDDYELKSSVKFKSNDTNKSLDIMLEKIVHRLQSCFKNDPEKYAQFKFANKWDITSWAKKIKNNWHQLFNSIDKTMIVCKSRVQAKQVLKYFTDKDIKSALSISGEGELSDNDSSEIQRFKNEKDCKILIVVGRGILGFNFPELETVIDMTGSQNINRIFQLLCRVIRPHPENKKKLFFKIAPIHQEQYMQHIMDCTMCLCFEEYYLKYNGKNFLDLSIPVQRVRTEKKRRESIDIETSDKKNKQRTFKNIDYIGQPAISFFKDIIHINNDELSSYAHTDIKYTSEKMGDIRRALLFELPKNQWTKEECLSDAKKYKKLKDWLDNSYNAYCASRRWGWYDECVKHMVRVNSIKLAISKDECIADAKKYNTPKEWRKNSHRMWGYACKQKGWLKECQLHMIKKRMKWTKKECIESAKKFNKKQEWQKKCGGAAKAARENGWMQECCKHFIGGNIRWTKEMCLKKSKKFKSSKDWREKDPLSYGAAYDNGWLKECQAHMKSLRKKWNDKEVLLDAKKFKTRVEWMRKSAGAYNYAREHNLLDKCCKHMKMLKKPNGTWTVKSCILDAKKYNTISEWNKNSGSAYNSARRLKCFDECIKHMKRLKAIKIKWNINICINDAKKYNSIESWRKNSNRTYSAALKYGWLSECTRHMK